MLERLQNVNTKRHYKRLDLMRSMSVGRVLLQGQLTSVETTMTTRVILAPTKPQCMMINMDCQMGIEHLAKSVMMNMHEGVMNPDEYS